MKFTFIYSFKIKQTVREWLQDICSPYSIPSLAKDSSFTLGTTNQKLNKEQNKLSLEPDKKDKVHIFNDIICI